MEYDALHRCNLARRRRPSLVSSRFDVAGLCWDKCVCTAIPPETIHLRERRPLDESFIVRIPEEGCRTMTTNAFSDLTRLINGYQITQAIHVASRLGIADHLGQGPLSSRYGRCAQVGSRPAKHKVGRRKRPSRRAGSASQNEDTHSSG